MKTDIFKTIETIIQLPFEKENFQSGAVCFANSEELRDDFKLHFTTYDVVNYVYGVLWQTDLNENRNTFTDLKIPFPKTVNFFWKYAEIGKKFRQSRPIEAIELVNCTDLNWVYS